MVRITHTQHHFQFLDVSRGGKEKRNKSSDNQVVPSSWSPTFSLVRGLMSCKLSETDKSGWKSGLSEAIHLDFLSKDVFFERLVTKV